MMIMRGFQAIILQFQEKQLAQPFSEDTSFLYVITTVKVTKFSSIVRGIDKSNEGKDIQSASTSWYIVKKRND